MIQVRKLSATAADVAAIAASTVRTAAEVREAKREGAQRRLVNLRSRRAAIISAMCAEGAEYGEAVRSFDAEEKKLQKEAKA